MKELEIFKDENNLRFSVGRFKNLPRDSQELSVKAKYYNVMVAELTEKRVEITLGEFQIVLSAEQAHELACHLVLAGFDAEKFENQMAPIL
ncbi:hypothetical protein [Pseudomonas sp. 10S4]|uniref:hypothetical protein n=1 Tax=Pseudomonas sp. 10S4 TaxID=3048583 RepID=UPI002AC9C8C7|nr:MULTISPECIES: hypothetical protein [unclassified Pseudomonas]MEB0222883.1 hypothetical protein [Pseudomonas sp. 5S1]MEB0293072.1 hypothetical protein [Pseudomonas sp. 10S4]WPX17185.1 hypothetical protein RHM58_25185 [Pseudomonas sp. 10S4]